MNKVEEKARAIKEIADLMTKYTEFVDTIKDQPFTAEVREQLRAPGTV